MRVSAITVSINYADYLSQCISNRKHLDDWLIVTAPDDSKTLELCSDNHLDVLTTDIVYSNQAYFAKGKAINLALQQVRSPDWLLQLDSDIKLPDNFRDILNQANLDRNCIYGCKRQYNGQVRIEINPKTHERHERPLIGFFQLWHSSRYSDYPALSLDAGNDDEQHACRFKYPDEWKYLNMIVEDVSGVFCKNWYGRNMKRRKLWVK